MARAEAWGAGAYSVFEDEQPACELMRGASSQSAAGAPAATASPEPPTAAPLPAEAPLPHSSAGMRRMMRAMQRPTNARNTSAFSLLGDGDDATGIDVDLEVAIGLKVRWMQAFWEIFFIQLFAPYSTPYAWARYGWQAVVNMKVALIVPPLSSLSSPRHALELSVYALTWALVTAVIAIYAARHRDLAEQGITFAELTIALVMFVTHRFMVGVKYATMTAGELRLFLVAPQARADAYNARIQLLSGVWDPQIDMVYREVTRAWRHVLTSGTLPHKSACTHTLHYSFKVERGQEARWRNLLAPLGDASPFVSASRDGGERRALTPAAVQVDDVLCALVLRSTAAVVTPRFKKRCEWASSMLGLAFSAMPACLRVIEGLPPLGRTPCAVAFAVCCAILTMTWWRTHCLFLVTIGSYYERIAVEREMLSALITEHDGPVLAEHELRAARHDDACDDAGAPPAAADAAADADGAADGDTGAAPRNALDASRRKSARAVEEARVLRALARAHWQCGAPTERVSDWPTLSLDSPSAVRVFALLWKLQLSYGRAYALRMTIYNTLTCAVAALVFALLLWGVVQHGRLLDSVDGPASEGAGAGGAHYGSHAEHGGAGTLELRLAAEDRLMLRESLPVNMSLLLTAVLAAIFYWHLRAGSRANEQVETLQLHMLAGVTSAHATLEQLNHFEKSVPHGSAQAAGLLSARHLAQQAVELLQHEIAAMSVLASLEPVRFLGVRASMSLARGFGTSILTAAVVLLDRVYGVSVLPYLHILDPGLDDRRR